MRALLVFALGVLVLVSASTARAAEQAPDAARIEAARTPEAHGALADGFRSRAAESKRLAEEFRAMSAAYAKTDAVDRMVKAAYCQQIATEYEELAVVYQALAESEQQAAAHR
jgi:hypothetical protein